MRLISAITIGLLTGVIPAAGQDRGVAPPAAARGARPPAPTRDPKTPGYVAATELPDGAVPPLDAEGNFILGPTHNAAPEMTVQEGVPHGAVYNFTMNSADSKIYPGIAREPGTSAQADPSDPTRVTVNSYPAPYTRRVAVYVPQQYVPGTVAPFIVGADGPDQMLFTALDNLIAQKRVPVMIAISIGNGSGDAQGSQRGLEYDTMSGLYAEFVEKEVLPLVEQQYNVKLTKDPDARATMGGSSGGSAALAMAWYHTDLYHRVLTYSGTYVNQQYPHNPATPLGAWEFHKTLIPNSPVKPIRIWMEVGDRDNLSTRDDYHDWVLANELMAKALTARGYHYQFLFARNAGHTDRTVKAQTLPQALEWVWRGYSQARPTPPTRDPNTPGYVAARELPDGAIPPAGAEGNFIIGPTHNPAPEMSVQPGVPQGTVREFTMSSADSKIYPGIAREQGTFGEPDPRDPAKLIVTTSRPAPYTRRVAVYVPQQYVPGTTVPFIVGADGPDPLLFTALDNLIAQKRVPVMIAISIANGSGDAQGSQRGLEYDTMSGRYAEFVETEVLPLVEKQYNVKLTKDPNRRATTGCSSGAAAALSMAWYRPDLYHRVLSYSGTYVNQQWPSNPDTPGGAWEYHRSLIPRSPAKPIRLWMQVGDRDLLNPNVMRDEMHDWVLANERMAKELAARRYHYQFVFTRNAGHCDRATKLQTLPAALEWLWK